ncbi:MAG: phosphoribosylanthranilate isomerase, partial [Dehalococcoidia bacterium]
MVRVKICGLTEPEHAVTAAAAGADFIGLVFAEQSRRHVSVHQAKAVIAALPVPALAGLQEGRDAALGERPVRWFDHSAAYLGERLLRKRPLAVGVFADMPATMINAIADRVGLDLVQLSGHEPWEEALAVRRPVIKAIRLGSTSTESEILDQIEVGTASLCLLDTDVKGALGGTGETFDWRIASAIAAELPVMLAGGLTAENVGSAIA